MKLCSLVLLSVVIASAQSSTVNVQVGNQINPQVGVNGRLQLAMSTSFQLAPWSYQFFSQAPQAGAALGALYPWHTRVQVISTGIPLTAPDTWDFSELDAMLSPIQAAGDHSPEFQIGTAPAYLSDSSGHILPGSFSDFAQMSANLVRYYNTGGFDDAGAHYQSPTPYPVTWWGIFNEPNINGLTAQQYVTLYNTMVPVMAQVDPSIKFLAVELADFYQQPQSYLPTFVAGVTARVDIAATHFYSTCNQKDTDATIFATVPGFAADVEYFHSELAANPALAAVPVWVTENNVNADYDAGNGISACNGTPFVTDLRGTSPFFAAWRAYVFSQLGQAGTEALYHWAFGADQQFGEVDGSGRPFFSYWVDYYLSHWLPSPPGQDILQVTADGTDTDTLAARNVDGSVVILMSNRAVQNPNDNNGTGVPRTFALDLSALGSFSSATLVTLDAATPAAGPVPAALNPSAQMQVTLPGYGAALLRLANTQPNLPAAGVVNAASYGSPEAVAPGEIVSLFGTSIGPAVPAHLTLTNPRLVANSLAGVHVLFDGVPAPVLYASAGQVNAVVPYSVAGQLSTQVQVEYLGALSAPVTLAVVATAPGVFALDGSGTGPGAIVNAADGSVNSAAHPAAPGDWVSIYLTGAGATTQAGVDGLLPSGPSYLPNAKVSVTIGNLDCNVNYAGAAPGYVSGLVQVNAQIPASVASGSDIPVQVKIGTATSQAGVTLAVR